MPDFDFEALSSLGLTPLMAGRAAALAVQQAAAELHLVRITEVHRGTLTAHDGVRELSMRVLPRVVRMLADEGTVIAAGDWAWANVDPHRAAWVTHRVPPVSTIARRDGEGRAHAIVSNVDVVVLVMGLDADFNPRRLERFLALVHDDAIVPVVVLTKADLVSSSERDERIDELRSRISSAIEIAAVDATDAAAARALAGYCTRGTTLVMLGSSGAGKSTLTNTLIGEHVQDTGAVRVNDGRGKHTTTSRSLHRLPGGACVIDTPGIRTLRPVGDATALSSSFADVESLAAHCRFADCRHGTEPGCAVRERVDGDRLRNYHKLLRELRRDTLTALERQRHLAQMKVRGRAVRVKMKLKRGDGFG